MIPSPPPDNAQHASLLRAIQVTQPRMTFADCWKTRRQRPVESSQRRRVLSELPESAHWPSSVMATPEMLPLCPSKTLTHRPVRKSQTRAVSSLLPEIAMLSSWLVATAVIHPPWPSYFRTHCPVKSQSLNTLSLSPESMLSRGVKTQEETLR